ncbi:MAG: Plug domain-containing protein, partial [Pseudomonadota bacterium]
MNTHQILAACLAASLAAPVHANVNHSSVADEGAGDPERIVITGTRSEETLNDQPIAISVVDSEQIERELPRTVPEALATLPGVLVQKTASGHGSPYIRGFTGNRTLLVIDGVRYNNATFRDGANEYFAQIDAFTLDQIELIAGPASALFGSEAVGGVLNLTTRGTGIFETSGLFLSGEQTIRVSSGDHSIASRTV